MKDWMARGLPIRRKRFSAKARVNLRAAALPAIAAVAAAALYEPIPATLLLGIAGILLLTPKSSRGKRVRQGSWIVRKHAFEGLSWPKDAMLVQGETH
jgi:hypothetical protein